MSKNYRFLDCRKGLHGREPRWVLTIHKHRHFLHAATTLGQFWYFYDYKKSFRGKTSLHMGQIHMQLNCCLSFRWRKRLSAPLWYLLYFTPRITLNHGTEQGKLHPWGILGITLGMLSPCVQIKF